MLEYFLSKGFFQLPSLSDVVQQVATCAQLHDYDDVLLGFDGLVYLDHVVVAHLQQQIDFLHQLGLVGFISQHLLVQRFEGHELADQLMHGQVYLPKGTPAQHLADPVECHVCGGRPLRESECLGDLPHDVADLLGAGTESLEVSFLAESLLGLQQLPVERLFVDVGGHLPDLVLLLLSDQGLVVIVRVSLDSLNAGRKRLWICHGHRLLESRLALWPSR